MSSSETSCPSMVSSSAPHGASLKNPEMSLSRMLSTGADAVHRIVVEDHLHGERIVEVDPVRHLLGPRVAPDRQGREPLDVALQRGSVGFADRGVSDPVHPVVADPDVALENPPQGP